MKCSTSVLSVLLVVSGLLAVGSPATGAGRGGGGFGGGGFHGGSVGNAGHVNNHVGWGGYGPTPAFGETTDPIGWEDPATGAASQRPASSGGAAAPQDMDVPAGPVNQKGMAELGAGKSDQGWWEAGNDHLGLTDSADAVVGTTVTTLPKGYETLGGSGGNYYYRNGTFYRPGASGYDVVDAPIGAEVRDPPADGKFVGIGGQQYLVYKNTYYQAFYSGSGPVYKVVQDPNPS